MVDRRSSFDLAGGLVTTNEKPSPLGTGGILPAQLRKRQPGLIISQNPSPQIQRKRRHDKLRFPENPSLPYPQPQRKPETQNALGRRLAGCTKSTLANLTGRDARRPWPPDVPADPAFAGLYEHLAELFRRALHGTLLQCGRVPRTRGLVLSQRSLRPRRLRRRRPPPPRPQPDRFFWLQARGVTARVESRQISVARFVRGVGPPGLSTAPRV
jgi:hypothetical protein